MMKSWADHCSSDEESDDGIHHPARGDVPAIMENVVEEEEEVNDEGSFHEENDGGPPPPVEGDYSHLEFPSKPPFTAHLSNLNFKIKDEEALCHHVETMVDYRYRMRGKGLVHAVNARFGTDRATGSRKGFGYVDVQSLDELILLLNLNDGFSQLLGRSVRIELAQSSRNKKDWNNHNNKDRRVPDVDGSKFQGGRYSNRNNNNNNNNNNNQQKINDTLPSTANKQRPTLKLKPRSTDSSNGSNKGVANTKSNIFGGAKPRDESAWSGENNNNNNNNNNKQSNHSTDSSTPVKDDSGATEVNNDNNKRGMRGRERVNSKDGDRKMSNKDNTSNGGRGRGGRGRGGKGGGGGKGENGKQNRPNNNRKTGKEKERKKTDDHKTNKPIPVQKTAPAPETAKKPTASANAFAALGFDSDSD